jgi:hypothetical protein
VTLPRRSYRPRHLRVWQVMALIGVVIAMAFWSRQGSPPVTRREAGEPLRMLTGPVVSVIDGDTIGVQLDGRRVRVRYRLPRRNGEILYARGDERRGQSPRSHLPALLTT